MTKTVTGVILAGGLNSRFGGFSKALAQVGSKPILDHILQAFQGLFAEILLVTNDPQRYLDRDITIVTDIVDCRSSLTGLHTALFYAHTEAIFVTACDTPFVRPQLIQKILEAADHRWDVVVPKTTAGTEPLCAAYSCRCLKPIERLIAANNLKIYSIFDKVRTCYLSEDQLRQADPDLVSFVNINRPEQLAAAEKTLDQMAACAPPGTDATQQSRTAEL